MPINVEIAKEFRFEAAHSLPHVPCDHKCHKLHGHSYGVTIRLFGPINEQEGWLMDLSELSDRFAPTLKILDHANLNEIEGLENPTSENIVIWIFKRLTKDMPELSSVTLEATNRISVTVTKKDMDLYK